MKKDIVEEKKAQTLISDKSVAEPKELSPIEKIEHGDNLKTENTNIVPESKFFFNSC